MKFDFLSLIDGTEDTRRKISDNLSVPDIFRAYAMFLLTRDPVDLTALEKFESHEELASYKGEWLFHRARCCELQKDWQKAYKSFKSAACELKKIGSVRRFAEAVCGEFISKYHCDKNQMSLAEWNFVYQRAKQSALWGRLGELLVIGYYYHQSHGMPGAALGFEKKMRKLGERSPMPSLEDTLGKIAAERKAVKDSGLNEKLSTLEKVLVDCLQGGPKSKEELMAGLYPNEDYFVAENRFKNLLSRVRNKMRNAVLFDGGKYVLASGVSDKRLKTKKAA